MAATTWTTARSSTSWTRRAASPRPSPLTPRPTRSRNGWRSWCRKRMTDGAQGLAPALELGDKEAVGAVPRRGQAQVVLAARRGAADRFLPGARRRVEREIGMLGEKRRGLVLV